MRELSENVKTKLSEAVELWAEDNLVGKPAILANAMYMRLESVMKEQAKEIYELFK